MKKLLETELQILKEYQTRNNKIVGDLGNIELNINILKFSFSLINLLKKLTKNIA